MDTRNETTKGIAYIIFSAVIYGCMPILAKTLYASGVTPLSLVLLRNALALPFLFAITAAGGKLRLGARTMAKVGLGGLLGSTLTPLLLFSSYAYMSSGAATTVHYVYPIFVMLICVLGFRERLSLVKLVCLLLSSAGVALLYSIKGSMDVRGLLLAFLSGVTFAGYTVLIGKSELRLLNPFQLNLYSCTVSTLLLLPTVLLGKQFGLPQTPRVWLLCAAFALMVSLGAMSLFQAGTRLVGPQRAAILSTFEPITSIVLGVLLFSEPFSAATVCGMICILASVILLSVFEDKSPLCEPGAAKTNDVGLRQE